MKIQERLHHTRTRIASPLVMAATERRSLSKPVIVTGIGKGELVTITPSMFSKLDVDPAYQRGETSMINNIVRALQAGGQIHDPVTLCVRNGGDKLWVVDGHQRVCAFQQLKMPFVAMLHKSASPESEHSFFIALNSKRGLSANVIVKAWTGPIGGIMRKANESLEHPMYDRINFSQAAAGTRLAASSLVRALLAVVGNEGSGRIEVSLSKLDNAMAKSMQKARVEHYLRLIGKVCPSGTLPALVLRAIGSVAHEQWEHEVKMPSVKTIERLRLKQWAASVVLLEKYQPVLIDIVRKMWR